MSYGPKNMFYGPPESVLWPWRLVHRHKICFMAIQPHNKFNTCVHACMHAYIHTYIHTEKFHVALIQTSTHARHSISPAPTVYIYVCIGLNCVFACQKDDCRFHRMIILLTIIHKKSQIHAFPCRTCASQSPCFPGNCHRCNPAPY